MNATDYEKNLNEFMWENGRLSTVEQGKRFLQYALLNLFGRTETDLENNDLSDGVLYTDGARDSGIDCAFIDGDILYIIQGKYRDSHSYENVYSFKTSMEKFLSLTDARDIRSALVDVYNAIHNDDINEIKIYYITNNWIEREKVDYSYASMCNAFSSEFSEKLEKNIFLQIVGYEDYSKIHTGMILQLPKAVKNAKSTLLLARHFENRDKTTVVAEVALKDLASLVSEHRTYIFFSNIRNYKGLNKINQGIKSTYENSPKDFWYYNNGITIVCDDYDLTDKQTYASITIKAPQIVNGCQTSTTICDCWSRSNKEDKQNVDGTILVKIIKDSRSQRRRNITQYTNKQTAVSGKDFFALDDFHKELQQSFAENGYFYEIQSNSASKQLKKYPGNVKYRHLFDVKFIKSNAVSAKEVTQIYIATFLKMPAKAKNIGQFMPGNERYDQVFNENAPNDYRFYFLPYAVWYYLKKVYDLPVNRVIDKDKWQNSLLFIAYVFFEIIDKKYNTDNHGLFSNEFINICDSKISDEQSFQELVDITYNVMKEFYNDYTIKNIIGDNLPRFLKSTIETNTNVKEILCDKIDGMI